MHEWLATEHDTEDGHFVVKCKQCGQYATEPDENQWMVYQCECGAWHLEEGGECYLCDKTDHL